MRNLKTVNYDEMFTLSAPSPKWVWNAQGQLVEVPAGQPAFGYDRFTGEPLGQIIEAVDATGVLLNSFAPATQTVSVSDATAYTLSVYGSGSAEITAGGSGTATDGSPLTFTTTGTSVTVTVTGTLDVFQLEAGSVATSPIETAGSAVTRAADVALIQNIDVAEWFDSDEFTLSWIVSIPFSGDSPQAPRLAFSNGTNANRIQLDGQFASSDPVRVVAFVEIGDSIVFLGKGGTPWTPGVPKEIELRYGPTGAILKENGVTIASFSGALPPGPPIDRAYIGRRSDGAAPSGRLHVENIKYSKTADLSELDQ